MEHPLFVLCVIFPRQSGSFWQTPEKNGGGTFANCFAARNWGEYRTAF